MELDQLKWTDARKLGVLGQGWTDTDRPYDRFPKRMQPQISEALWDRSRHASGLRLHFVTDSPVLAADWTLPGETLVADRMPPVGGSGLDLYVRRDGAWRWASVASSDSPPCRSRSFLLQEMTPGQHEYILYLPLLNAVSSLSLGIAPGAKLLKPEPQP